MTSERTTSYLSVEADVTLSATAGHLVLDDSGLAHGMTSRKLCQ